MDTLEDDQSSMVGVWGMPGVGKTTLMKRLNNELPGRLSFKKVIMVTVSGNPRWQEIQAKIGERLGLKLAQIDETVCANRLSKRLLEECPFLIILDDVWHRFEVSEIGIPCGAKYKGCKIVLTTRIENVCREMGIKRFILDRFTEEESRILFRMKAGEVSVLPNLQGLAEAIVTKCGGLPLAIVTLGESLRDEENDIVWKQALKRFTGQIPTLVSSIEFSFDQLKEETLKGLFLFCCIYPEDYNIPLSDLRMYGVGEGFLKEERNLEGASNTVHSHVIRLKKCSLLVDGDWEDVVKMHDVVRTVAIEIASRNEFGFWIGTGQKLYRWPMGQNLRECKRISLMGNDIIALPDRLECPKLLTLQLEGNSSLDKILEKFFQETKELRVLNLEGTKIKSIGISLSYITNLRVLNLRHCCELYDLSPIGELKKLEILDLRDSLIQELPKDIGNLITLRVLDLTRTKKLKQILPNVISRLIYLEELYMAGSFSAWQIGEGEEESNTSIKEVMSLAFLTAVTLDVENVRFLTLNVHDVWKNLSKFEIKVYQSILYWNVMRKYSRCLKLSKLLYPITSWVKWLLEKTECLNLDCSEELKSVPHHYAGGFPCLKLLDISNCNGMRHLIDSVGAPLAPSAFQNLEYLYLDGLEKLELISDGNLADGFLGSLRVLEIRNCNKLKCILAPNIPHALPKLETLRVQACANIQSLSSVNESPIFCNLKLLEVERCGNLISIISNNVQETFQCLESLYVRSCEGMEYLADMEETSVAANPFENLRELILDGMENLINVFKGMVFPGNMRELNIFDCHRLAHINSNILQQSLETIKEITIDGLGEMEYLLNVENESVLRPNVLARLRKMSISQFKGTGIFEGPLQQESLKNLRHIIIVNCEGLMSVFSSHDVLSRLQCLEYLSIRCCVRLQEVFMLEGLGQDLVVFPNLETLVLENLPKISSIQEGYVPDGSFEKLKMLNIGSCENLRYLFSHGFSQRLNGIERLEILGCPQMQNIILGAEEPSLYNMTPTSSTLFLNLRRWPLKNVTA